MSAVSLDGQSLNLGDIHDVVFENKSVTLNPRALRAMESSRQFVLTAAKEGRAIYGITTGLGALASTSIGQEDLETLQVNLVRSHSTGVGSPCPGNSCGP